MLTIVLDWRLSLWLSLLYGALYVVEIRDREMVGFILAAFACLYSRFSAGVEVHPQIDPSL